MSDANFAKARFVNGRNSQQDETSSTQAVMSSAKRGAFDDEVPAHRPLLIFNHNPKAGGGSIKMILKELKPNVIQIEDKDRTWWNQRSTLSDFKQAFNRTKQAINVNNTYVYVRETMRTRRRHRQMGFVIGSVREPCSQYLSLWSFRSTGNGGFVKQKKALKDLYGQDAPFYDSDSDIERFRKWARHPIVAGAVGDRFINSYGVHQEGVDCWVYVESFQASLVDCLKQYEEQGGYVDWLLPGIQSLVSEARTGITSKATTTTILTQAQNNPRLNKNDPLGNPQEKHHATCESYFTPDLANLTEHGPEEFIYQAFGYSGCCSKHRTTAADKNGSPEKEVTARKKEVLSSSEMLDFANRRSVHLLTLLVALLLLLCMASRKYAARITTSRSRG